MLCYILGLLVVKLTSNLGVFFEINCTFGLTHTLCEVDGRGRDHSLLLKNAAVGNLSSFTFRRSPPSSVLRPPSSVEKSWRSWGYFHIF